MGSTTQDDGTGGHPVPEEEHRGTQSSATLFRS